MMGIFIFFSKYYKIFILYISIIIVQVIHMLKTLIIFFKRVIVSPISAMFGSIQYVGVLKDIIFLGYGLVSQATIFLKV